MSDSPLMFAPGWHRKWLLLLVALVAGFLYRYRLMGLLLSKVIAFQLAKKKNERKIEIDVQVKLVLLRPLQFVHVAVTSGSDWTLLFTKITLHCYIKEFFRSFGQTKIWVLEIGDVVGELHRLDESLLHELLHQTPPSHPTTPAAASANADLIPLSLSLPEDAAKTNPVGFLRFVDFQVSAIQLKLRCFEIVTEFRCRALSVGITDVLVSQNLLYVKVQASSVYLRSYRETKDEAQSVDGVIKDGIRFNCPNLCLIADLQLMDRHMVGFKLVGNKQDLVSVQLCTAFMEFLALKKLELVQRGLVPIPKRSTPKEERSGSESSAAGPVHRILTKDISDLHFSVTIIHELQEQIVIPVQFAAEISHLSTTKRAILPNESQERFEFDFSDEMIGAPEPTGVCVHAILNSVHVKAGREFKQDILFMSTLEVNATQTHQERGTTACTTGDVEMFLNPRIAAIFHSLTAAGDRLKEYDRECAMQMAKRGSDSQSFAGDYRPESKQSSRIEWGVCSTVRSWTVKVVLQTKSSLAEEMVVGGQNTTMTTKIALPATTGLKQYVFQIEEIRANAITPFAKEKQMHSILFLGVELAISKEIVQDPQLAKRTGIDAAFRSVSVNDLIDGNKTSISQFPAAHMKDVKIKRQDKRAKESADTEMSVSIAESHVHWSHRMHAEFLMEWSAIMAIIDKVDVMLTLPRAATASKDENAAPSPLPRSPELLKTLVLDVRSENIEVALYDVRDVAQLVTIRLTDVKAVHQTMRLTTQTSFDCAQLTLMWGDCCPAIELSGACFAQKVLVGPQRLLAKVPIQSTIKAAQLRVFTRPGCRLLLLLLRFDELLNSKKSAKEAESSERKPSRQGVSFECAKLAIEVHEKSFVAGEADGNDYEIHHVLMDSLEAKTVISKSFEMTESVTAFVEMIRQEDPSGQVAFAESIDRIMSIEGSIAANSLALLRFANPVAHFRDVETQFAMTDIARRHASTPTTSPSEESNGGDSPRTIIFDFSALAKYSEIIAEKKLAERFAKILPAIQETFDTREAMQSDDAPEPAKANWRQRYIGNVDIGTEQCNVLCPYGDSLSASPIVDASFKGYGERTMRVAIKDAALNLRQFQKLAVQFSSLRVLLEEPHTDFAQSSLGVELDPPLQCIFLPLVKLDAFIHWKEEKSTKEGAANGVQSPSTCQHFAVSCELAMKSKTGSVTHVPIEEEALLALNWDYVYPLLVYFLTEDEEDDQSLPSGCQAPKESSLKCIGFQWDVSIDLIQVAWWDVLTKEVGLLLVANDFLSHGIARSIQPRRVLQTETIDSHSTWIIYEATIYVDVFRGYMLRDPLCDSELGEAAVVESELLPFYNTKVSNFFFETVGTSYRFSYSPDDVAEDGSVAEEVESLFRACVGHFFERVHDNFKPIEFQFSLFGSTKLRRSSSVAAMPPAIQVSTPSTTSGSAANPGTSSPAKPGSWAQTVRAKLTRLKRRSSSMDNLLLNDGSCPIQVDSMKLLWTIETRDTVFYMASLTVDSIQRLIEAKQEQQERVQAAVRNVGPGSSTPQQHFVKIHSWRPPSSPSRSNNGSPIAGLPCSTRRGSTRDTLLDLLQQGKLGTKQSTLPDQDGVQGSDDGSDARCPTRTGEGEDMNVSKSIAFKKYTVDIHDAQINIREENSRSSILVATKHIHLEVGLDEFRSHNVAHLKFDSLTAHTAPVDVDISAGVLWYSHSTTSPIHSPRGQSPSSGLLKQVMEECSLRSTYSQALATGATAVEIDLSFLQLATDRHQFFQLLNVIRHVLLAPPTIVRRPKRAQATTRNTAADTQEPDGSDLMVFPASPSASVPLHSTKKIRAQLMEELRNREAKQMNSRTSVIALRFISFRAEGSLFRLRSSPETTGVDYEFVEIRTQGIAGSHVYYASQCTKFILNLQWMEINNLRPGPSSIAFEDAMAVLKAKLLLDKRYQSSSKVDLVNQKGMLTIRAESGPLIRVLGQKLRVLDVLEVSVFPEISNMIVIQLASDFYELVYKFFFEQIGAQDHHDVNSEQVLFGRKAGGDGSVGGAAKGSVSPCVRGRAATSWVPASPGTPTHTTRRKSIQISGSTNSLVADPNASFLSTPSAASSSVSQSVAPDAASSSIEDDDSSTDGCELFYFKYVRIGNVRLRINCNGFFVNLSDFDLDLPPYVCQGKLYTTKKLLQKFESHLKWYVTKESASSGLSHFKNKFLKWTPSSSASSEKKDKNKKEEDSSTINAQVLFGPYSGAAT